MNTQFNMPLQTFQGSSKSYTSNTLFWILNQKSSVFCGFQIWVGSNLHSSFRILANLTASSRNITGPVGGSSPKHRGLKRRWCIVYKKVGMRASLGLIGASYRWVVSGSCGSESWLLSQGGLDGRLKEHGFLRCFFVCFCVAGRCVPFLCSEASRVSQRDGIRWLIPKNYINATSRMLRQLYKSNMLGAEKQILRWESLPAKKYHLFFWDAVRSWCHNHPKAVFVGGPWLPMVAEFLVDFFGGMGRYKVGPYYQL